jgi:hypothetical protein
MEKVLKALLAAAENCRQDAEESVDIDWDVMSLDEVKAKIANDPDVKLYQKIQNVIETAITDGVIE